MATIPLKITGLGILNALGVGRSIYWQQLLSGTTAIAPIEGFDTTACMSNIGAEIHHFDQGLSCRLVSTAGLAGSPDWL